MRKLGVLGVAAVAAVVALAAPAFGSTAATQIAPVLGGQCPAGTTPLTPDRTTALPGGGWRYDYVIDGQTNSQYLPPAGFKPTTASDDQLAEYAFPPRPAATNADRPKWNDAMGAYRSTAESRSCLRTGGSAHASFYNWAGYVGQGNGFTDVSAHYNQPAAQNCSCTGVTDEATWVGIGGYANNDGLIQDGTEIGTANGSYAWHEALCGNNCGQLNQIISGGVPASNADIYDYTYWRSGTAGFFISQNGTALMQASTSGLSGAYYDGRYADFIAERPTTCSPNLCFRNLAHFGQINWSSASGNGTALASLNPIGIEMVRSGPFVTAACSSRTLLAYPFGISGGTFHTAWCRAS